MFQVSLFSNVIIVDIREEIYANVRNQNKLNNLNVLQRISHIDLQIILRVLNKHKLEEFKVSGEDLKEKCSKSEELVRLIQLILISKIDRDINPEI
jgi:hypothetical protein